MNDKVFQYENIWKKDNKMKRKILDWLTARKVENTYENAKDYWLGRIKPFTDPRTGKTIHLNTKTDWKAIRRFNQRGKYGKTKRKGTRNDASFGVPKHNRPKKRRFKQ